MKPVDKIAARNSALADLGLSPSASSDEIREAWRNIAFRAHPDHMPGDCEDFSRAKTAYDFLRKQGLGAKGASGPQMPKRPRLKKRVIELPPEDISACKSILNPTQALAAYGKFAINSERRCRTGCIRPCARCRRMLWPPLDLFRSNASHRRSEPYRPSDLGAEQQTACRDRGSELQVQQRRPGRGW